ncbi:NUDIX domain-containing protein [Cytobacillus purgationiresistens]|uniref:8-oxo-dGTP pyrophosphatase MutT (NUDIX family) n=1 Tax=Cytobacillus purgationiresistens TaxID=863449 RepID=A0ABU0AL08_9BACI|nr:NUDIX domain-containing protein [Cytobacillus purgationiresistens]MDQ0271462.1 8-oxo-dGTP pyrophosphatase MutT (NUDIX family) [Cytobacillus purgationiresistens]
MTIHIRVRAGAIIIEKEAILLAEFKDESGLHYNFPAGGVEPGETVIEAVKREAMEEASVDVEVGPLAFVYEFASHMVEYGKGKPHSVGLMFECKLKEGSVPALPKTPDENQTGVKWIPLHELSQITLYPNMKAHILNYVKDRRSLELSETHLFEVKG